MYDSDIMQYERPNIRSPASVGTSVPSESTAAPTTLRNSPSSRLFQGCSPFRVRMLFLNAETVPGSKSLMPDVLTGTLSVGPDIESVIIESISSGVHL